MKKLYANKNIVLLFFIVTFLITLYIKFPLKINSSLSDVLPTNNSQKIPSKIYSSYVNIIIKEKSFKIAKQDADLFYNELKKHDIKNITYKLPKNLLENATNYFKTHQFSFLLNEDKYDIKNNNEKNIVGKSINFLSSSLLPTVLNVSNDPFSITNRYISNLLQTLNFQFSNWHEKQRVMWQKRKGYNYILMNIKVANENAKKLESKIKKIFEIKNSLNIQSKIYISGSPIHTVIMFNKTRQEITFISSLSCLALFTLSLLLLRKISSVIEVFINLLVGFSFGFLGLLIFFDEIHLLSFVFGLSIIGICIDYSFHVCLAKNINDISKLKKSLFYSFITTVSCFIPLLFLSIPLLNQIGVFTIFGLIGTYIFVVKLNLSKNAVSVVKYNNETKFKFPFLNHKLKIFIMASIVLFIIFNIKNLNIENKLSNLYKITDKELLKSESLFYKLNGDKNSQFLLIYGKSLQEVLKTSETIKDKFNISLISDIFPSIKRQKENMTLIKKLYDTQGLNIQKELMLDGVVSFKDTPLIYKEDFKKAFSTSIYNKFFIKDRGVWGINVLNDTDNIINNEMLPKNVKIISIKDVLSNTLLVLSKETYISLYCSLGFLTILIFSFYRKKALAYLAPSILSLLLTLVIFNLTYGYVTFFHLISLFIVLGLSIDYTIFHLSKNYQDNLKPVLFSFFSSMIGFGLLSFVSFSIIKIMGQTIALGLLISYLLSLVLIKND